jgi:hypothetical protein
MLSGLVGKESVVEYSAICHKAVSLHAIIVISMSLIKKSK